MLTRLWLLWNWSQMELIVQQKKDHMVTVALCHDTFLKNVDELTRDLAHLAASRRSVAFGGHKYLAK
jgi:hypothetical protein